jgi:phosphoribosylformylglycinamidine synthase
MCVGIARHDGIVRARASGPGNVIVLVGAETGRDGLHGATFASVDDPEASHRGVIQVGNPFLEKLLLEACLELLEGDEVVAMQDLGAAGLTSSVVETASRGGVGAEIDVRLVPRRETGMSAYEVMLSESQERMLLVVRPDGVPRVREIVERWGLRAAEIGRVTDDGFVRIRDGGEVVAEVPARLFTDECPRYVREAAESPEIIHRRSLDLSDVPDLTAGDGPGSVADALVRLMASPNVGSRRPVYEQYDHTILTNTVVPPGEADAAVLRIKGTGRGVATKIDCNSRYCWLDPELGAMHAVAEATRNVSCVGARPLAITNCLNFGNPEKPAGSFQLSRAVAGMAAACRALGVPVVSGNVSLYNESGESAVMPTPTVGAVGVLDDVTRHATMRWRAGDVVLLLGAGARPTIGASEVLAYLHELTAGTPPPLDLEQEASVQAVVREAIAEGLARSAHDCGLGGLAVALAEMALVSGVGVVADGEVPAGAHGRRDERWFGEAAPRVLVACSPESAEATVRLVSNSGVPVARLGRVGGDLVVLGQDGAVALAVLSEASDACLTIGG